MLEGACYLLMNPFYIGLVRHGVDLYPGQHEPLVSQEVWEAVHAIRARRGEGKGGGRRADRVYLLARLERCAKCGLRLTAQTSEGKGRKGHETQYYLCPARRRSVDCPGGACVCSLTVGPGGAETSRDSEGRLFKGTSGSPLRGRPAPPRVPPRPGWDGRARS
jgi:hypothetical protein